MSPVVCPVGPDQDGLDQQTRSLVSEAKTGSSEMVQQKAMIRIFNAMLMPGHTLRT